MKSIFAILVTSLIVPATCFAQARDCSGAARSSVERADLFNPVRVTKFVKVTNRNRQQVAGLVEKVRGNRGLTPARKQLLLRELRNGSSAYSFFVAVTARNETFLALTDAASCAPYDAILLK